MTDLKIGDTVRLKSGGPKMTVNTLGTHGTLHCVWFRKKEHRSAAFEGAALKLVKTKANGVWARA